MEHCEHYTALISAAVDGELTEAEREKLMDHLAQCPGCREVYSQMMAMHAVFDDLEAEVELPGDLAGDVMAKVHTQKQVRRPRHYWWQITAAAACCALVILGYQQIWGGNLSENTVDGTAGNTAAYAADGEAGSQAAYNAAALAPTPSPKETMTESDAATENEADDALRESEEVVTSASDQEIMDDVLTYFRSSGPAVSTAMVEQAEDEDASGTVPCLTLSSSAPELETWAAENLSAEGYTTEGSNARAWIITIPEYEELTTYLTEQSVPYQLDGDEAPEGDSAGAALETEMVCVVYLGENAVPAAP